MVSYLLSTFVENHWIHSIINKSDPQHLQPTKQGCSCQATFWRRQQHRQTNVCLKDLVSKKKILFSTKVCWKGSVKSPKFSPKLIWIVSPSPFSYISFVFSVVLIFDGGRCLPDQRRSDTHTLSHHYPLSDSVYMMRQFGANVKNVTWWQHQSVGSVHSAASTVTFGLPTAAGCFPATPDGWSPLPRPFRESQTVADRGKCTAKEKTRCKQPNAANTGMFQSQKLNRSNKPTNLQNKSEKNVLQMRKQTHETPKQLEEGNAANTLHNGSCHRGGRHKHSYVNKSGLFKKV